MLIITNYVFHRIVCSKKFLDNYLLDYYPVGKEEKIYSPYISFNKLVKVADLGEYLEHFDGSIYYGFGFNYSEVDNEIFEVTFATRWKYPIVSIRNAIEKDHSVEWYAVEENCIYISYFYWSDGVQESISILGEEYDDWYENNEILMESIEDSDYDIWYYMQDKELSWVPWSESLGFPKFYND